MKNRLPDPSKVCALEFKREFRRIGIGSISATIDTDRAISKSPRRAASSAWQKKDRQLQRQQSQSAPAENCPMARPRLKMAKLRKSANWASDEFDRNFIVPGNRKNLFSMWRDAFSIFVFSPSRPLLHIGAALALFESGQVSVANRV